MGKVYVGQIDVEIKLDAKVTLGSPTVLQIAYKSPNGTKGVWPSAGNALVAETTKAQYFTIDDDLFESGLWTFQIYTELPGGFEGYGEEYQVWIYDPPTAS